MNSHIFDYYLYLIKKYQKTNKQLALSNLKKIWLLRREPGCLE